MAVRGFGVGLEHLLLRKTMCCLENDMAEALFGSFRGEAAWCGFEDADVGRTTCLRKRA